MDLSSPIMNINSLPDVVLRHIFCSLHFLDQLYLHHVCPKWKSLQLSVTSSRKSLTLFVGKRTAPPASSLVAVSPITIPYLDQIDLDSSPKKPHQESTLEFSKLHDDLTTQLVSLFPHIGSLCLVLNQTGHQAVDQVMLLLESWSKSLETFTFYCYFDNKGSNLNATFSEQIFKLIRFIDQRCLTLECLTFDVRLFFYDWKTNQTDLDLPFLARLREFKFYSYDDAKILFRSLKQYSNDRLERITIGSVYNGDDFLAEFAQHPQIAAKFNALPLSIYAYPEERQLFITFNSLTALRFRLGNLTLPEFTAYLAPLHSLLYLEVDMSLYTDDEQLSQYDATPSFEFHRLPSVKILVLIRRLTDSHTELHSRHWATIFPSVQFVKLHYCGLPCKECKVQLNPEGMPDGAIEERTKNQCLKMLLGTLKQCDQLKKIVTNKNFYFLQSDDDKNFYRRQSDDDKKEWTIEELN